MRSPKSPISDRMPPMNPQTTTMMDQAWQTAIAQANTIILPNSLWERLQGIGFTIDGPASRDLDDAIGI